MTKHLFFALGAWGLLMAASGCADNEVNQVHALPCNGETGEYAAGIPECVLQPEKVVAGVSDSLFFGWKSTFLVRGDRLFIPDETHARIVVADTAFRLVRVFGKKGRGPGELLQPMQMWMNEAGWLWVFGGAGQTFVAFDTMGHVLATAKMLAGKMLTRFFADENQRIWTSAPGEVDGDIVAFDTSGQQFWIRSGIDYLEGKAKLLQGRFHLTPAEKGTFWAIGESEPIFRKYDEKGELLAECDLRESPVVKKFHQGLEVKKQRMEGNPDQMTFLLVQDVALADDDTAFLLMYSYDLEGEVYLDKVWVVDLKNCTTKGIYRLTTTYDIAPFFVSMAFDPLSGKLYAYDNASSSFHVYVIPHYSPGE